MATTQLDSFTDNLNEEADLWAVSTEVVEIWPLSLSRKAVP